MDSAPPSSPPHASRASLVFALLIGITCALFAASSVKAFFPFLPSACTAEACIAWWAEEQDCEPTPAEKCLISFWFDVVEPFTGTLDAVIEPADPNGVVLSGDMVTLQLSASGPVEGYHPATVDLAWTPPEDVGSIGFPEREPDEQRGRTYVFRDLALTMSDGILLTDPVLVSYRPWPRRRGSVSLVDTLQVLARDEDGQRVGGASSLTQVLVSQRDAHLAAAPIAKAADVGYSDMELTFWFYDPAGEPFTTDMCDRIVSKRIDGEPFVALRYPVVQDPHRIPVVIREGSSPLIELLDETTAQPFQAVVSTTLSLRPEYHGWLASNLPAAPHERWVALGLDPTEPITCPRGVNLPAIRDDPTWETRARVALQLQVEEGTCLDCDLGLYYCVDLREASPAVAALAVGAPGLVASDDGDIICFGPHLWHVSTCQDPPLRIEIHGQGGYTALPGEELSVDFTLWNRSSSSLSLDLALASGLGDDWALYATKPDGQCDVSRPLDVPLSLGARELVSVCARGSVPADTMGVGAIMLTASLASRPEASMSASHLVLVADPEAGTPGEVALPLILRASG